MYYHRVLFRVVEGSPAYAAGLRPGDVVTHVNGAPIHGVTDLYELLEGEKELVMTVLGQQGNTVTRRIVPETT